MLLVLPILSFICAGLLAVFLIILIRRPTINTPNVALVLWLLFGNVVHSVNAIVWSSNVEARIPVWCDIVTKLLLGATIALPGVCLCSARYLELLSSSRKIYPNTYSQRLHTLLDVALCYVLPLLYMTLHFAVQDHRFDLMRDFGCSASIHRSTLAMSIMVLPPLILCSISLVLCMLAVFNYARLSSERFTSHLSARSSVSVPHFVRRLAKSILLTITVLLVTLIPPLLSPHPDRWAAFHANFDIIFIVKNARELGAAEVAWWAVPVVSIVYLVLSLVLGDEIVDSFAWMRKRFGRAAPREGRPQLSLVTFKHAMASKSSLVAPPSLADPHTIQLRSGWDNMLDVKESRRALPNRKSVISASERKSVASSASSSEDTLSASPTCMTPEDDAFTSSTLTYLASPVAQALGLHSPSPVASPPAAYASPLKTRAPSPVKVRAPSPPKTRAPAPPPLKLRAPLPPRQPIPEDTVSTISSIWDVPWPLPPASPSPVTRVADEGRVAYPMYSPMEPLTPPPFEGSSVPGREARSVLRKPPVRSRSLRRTWSREALARGYAGADVVYMTRTVEERA
ncbi:pheromone A receptor-domain-containing protein [Mycena epipterygia]|nr:pheromone A receptor-domain-containing protein [Mycena epipterygia]